MDCAMLDDFGIVGLASSKFIHLQGLRVTSNVTSSLPLVIGPRQIVLLLATTHWHQVTLARVKH